MTAVTSERAAVATDARAVRLVTHPDPPVLAFPPRSVHGDRRRWHDGPTPVSLADLTTITGQVAAEVAAGLHEVRVGHTHRWSRRLHADPHLDVWLISWATELATELHDHAGSLGALTVVSGELQEQRWLAEQGLRTRRLRAGKGATFALGHVHDVVNTNPAHAVSVHAYSPPLTAMSYYAVDPTGDLRRTRTVLTTGGEA